ncbi:metal-dependent hydrolase [Marinobacter sp. F3R08]|uniref:metal-dependent hydrolase n=1 Tax=Marinobacter sp. F3R08 TaxID=2841559 RepID=UPI001C080B19|nr:metal-dependent hydrolase [Marinobacter sp. F3R08]MBU2952312.1 metal-dependent hydrolase [Marinobacter sp. F3R08]
MPITPLHFGVLAPVNHFFPGKVSVVSFTLINLWMDGNAILYYGFGLDRPEVHGPMTHSMLAALVLASILALLGFRSRKWVIGAYVGGVTHVLLDMLVHAEMQPLYPIHWNPFYAGLMEPLSLILLPLTLWFVVQVVHDSFTWAKSKLAAS